MSTTDFFLFVAVLLTTKKERGFPYRQMIHREDTAPKNGKRTFVQVSVKVSIKMVKYHNLLVKIDCVNLLRCILKFKKKSNLIKFNSAKLSGQGGKYHKIKHDKTYMSKKGHRVWNTGRIITFLTCLSVLVCTMGVGFDLGVPSTKLEPLWKWMIITETKRNF